MLKIILILICHSCLFYFSIAQTDSLQMEREEILMKLKPFKDETERVKKKSFRIVGVLKEGWVGTTCGAERGAGTFIFKIKKSDKKEFKNKSINVIIACAAGRKDYFVNGNEYDLLITPEKSIYIISVKYDKIDKLKLEKFYCIEIEPLKK
ncbi:MAG: hypothetical protein Q8L90_14480 [Bacteroidota bacterium]|nr:hypothetical protein [Bacteroidota bacterium]